MKLSAREEDMITASSDLVGRSGASEMQVRYSDEQMPVVWIAVAIYPDRTWETAAGGTPVVALYRLLETLVNGGACTHCGKPTSITRDIDDQPLRQLVCWYQYDPELKVFRRGCEGS